MIRSENSGRLRIAVVDEELPYPLTSGKRIRTLNLLQRLARQHDIHYLCHRNPDSAEAIEAIAFFHDHGIRTTLAQRTPPPKSTLQGDAAFYARLAANLLSPLPYLVTSNCSAQLRQLIQTTAATEAFDLWHCEWTPYAQMMNDACTRPLLIVAHNVESTIWERYHENERQFAKRWYIKHQWNKLKTFEQRAFAKASQIVAVSECDAARIKDDFGAAHVDVVDNGVDTGYFRPTNEPRVPKQILFLGSLDWRPNLDAVKLLLEDIFPLVRKAEPDATLLLVGRNPPPWLQQQVAAATNVALHADVPDVRPFLNQSAVMSVPLRIGGGSRLKILEALACNLPVVSTAIGAEGLALEDDVHYYQADGTTAMADRLVESLQRPGPALDCARRGRQFVLAHYGWDELADKLQQIWWQVARTQQASPLPA